MLFCHTHFRNGPLFFEGVGGGLGNFQKKIPAQQKQLKKIVEGGPWGKNRTSVFYYPDPLFDFNKFLHKLLPTRGKKKKNYAQLKGEKKI